MGRLENQIHGQNRLDYYNNWVTTAPKEAAKANKNKAHPLSPELRFELPGWSGTCRGTLPAPPHDPHGINSRDAPPTWTFPDAPQDEQFSITWPIFSPIISFECH